MGSDAGGFHKCCGAKKALAAVIIAATLAACDRHPEVPGPPASPPKPVTAGGKIILTPMNLPARPVPPSPGEM